MATRFNRPRRFQQARRHLAETRSSVAWAHFLATEWGAFRSLSVLIERGNAAIALGDAARAEVWWLRAVAKAPQKAECHLGLGAARYHLGELSQAIHSFQAALSIAPALDAARISLAIAYLALDCPAQALSQAGHVLSRAPDHIDMRLTRASAMIKLGRATDAIPDLAWLHQRSAKLGEVGLLECEVNRTLGDYESALVLAAELAEAFPALSAPVESFRTTFEEFIARAPRSRVNDFLAGVGLPQQHTHIAETGQRKRNARDRSTTDVIIPVHDGLDHLKACLDSLELHRSPSLGRIILVDDGSSDQTRAWLRGVEKDDGTVTVVQTGKRSGFTLALTLGLAHSQSRRFVALNSDCVVSDGWLERLTAAMPPKGNVAMVGPLSNNAAWQSVGPVFDAAGNFAQSSMPSASEIERITSRLDLLKVFAPPRIALIHGFCALVDRNIYDRLRGLDTDLFPQGYGEFQDLSLRALDAGYTLRIAEDCFVAHVRGGSIAAIESDALSRAARVLLYRRHTALRYLSAECSASMDPQLAILRSRVATLDRYCPVEITFASTAAKVTIHGDEQADFAGQRVCLFVSFAPDGQLLPYTLHYLARLKASGFQTVLILNQVGHHRLPPEALDLARIVMLRDNLGLDFGAWRDAAARFPSVWQAETLLFTNDSIVGPFDGFESMIDQIAARSAPVFFLTESDFAAQHFQSFFWGLKGVGVQNPVIQAFLSSVRDVQDKAATIFLYEVFLRQVCEELAGLDAFCLFPLAQLSGVDSDIRQTFNPTHHLWRELLRAGFPFIKADFCRKNATGTDAVAWLSEIALHGGDTMLARLHLEAAKLQRMPVIGPLV